MLTFFTVTLLSCLTSAALFLKKLWNGFHNRKLFFEILLLEMLVVLMGYGSMIICMHYSVDSFNRIYDAGPFWELQIGRFFNCGAILLAQKFDLNPTVYQQPFFVLWHITLAVMIIMFTVAIAKTLKQITTFQFVLLMLAVSVSFINVFTMELMLFPETAAEFSISNLALGAAVYFPLQKSKNTLKDWLLCWVFLMLALGSYQSYIGIFTTFMLACIFLKFRENKKMRYTYTAAALLVGASASAANILITKLLVLFDFIADSGRNPMLRIGKIWNNLQKIASYQISFWKDADGLLPPGIMPAIACVLIVLIILCMRQLKLTEQKLYFVCMIAGCYLLAFAPHIIEENIHLTPRSNLAIWSVIAMIFVFSLDLCFKYKRYAGSFCPLTLILILCSNCLIMQDMAANEQMTNAIDLKEAQLIAEQIKIYENATGNIITKIAAVNDDNNSYWQPESRYRNGQLGARIMSTGYSNYRLIGYIMGRDFEKADMPEQIYETYFSGKNWDHLLLEEQLICLEDTAHIAIY